MPQYADSPPFIMPQVPADESEATPSLGSAGRIGEQQRESSGNLPDSSTEDPVRNDTPFKDLK